MANAAGFIQESIWRDSHWRQLSRTAQATYLQLLSQKELDCAGVLPLQANKWAKGCDSVTAAGIWSDLEELERERFIFCDIDTDEAFVRSYIRNSNVLKVPNMFKSALRSALLVGSEQIRAELATELRLTGRDEAVAVADQINPSGRVPEPLTNHSKSTLPEPFTEPTGVGVGVGTGVTLASSSVEEPSPFCKDHPNDTDKKCFACGQARRTYPERKDAWDKQGRESDAAARQAAIDACRLCDEFGEITFEDSVRKCSHQEAM